MLDLQMGRNQEVYNVMKRINACRLFRVGRLAVITLPDVVLLASALLRVTLLIFRQRMLSIVMVQLLGHRQFYSHTHAALSNNNIGYVNLGAKPKRAFKSSKEPPSLVLVAPREEGSAGPLVLEIDANNQQQERMPCLQFTHTITQCRLRAGAANMTITQQWQI